jgi:hypothetical protein
MQLHYRIGEEIRKGDRATYAAKASEIGLVADPELKDRTPEEYWYVQQFGGGVLVTEVEEHKMFGRVFLDAGGLSEEEDLVFVSRAMPRNEPR